MSCLATIRTCVFVATLLVLTTPTFSQEKKLTETRELQLTAPVEPNGNANRRNPRPDVPPMPMPEPRMENKTAGAKTPANNALSKPQTEIKIEFAEDASQPVLVMDVVGGFRMKSPDGFEPTPMLQIFSDGRVLTGRKSPLVKEVKGQLDLVDLQSLLVFVSDDCRFFDITSEMVKSDLEANRIGRIMDAGTTEVTVNLKEHSNRVGVYALPNVAGKFANVPSVGSMIAITSRCRRVISMTRLGSEKEAMNALQSVNKSVANEESDVPEFTLNNLQYAEQFVDGRRTATFVQEFTDGEKNMMAHATYQIDAKGIDSATLSVVEQRKQRGR